MNAFKADPIEKRRIISRYFILLKFIADRYSFPIRITIHISSLGNALQIQTRKMGCFSKTIRNLEINSNTFRDIDISLYQIE